METINSNHEIEEIQGQYRFDFTDRGCNIVVDNVSADNCITTEVISNVYTC